MMISEGCVTGFNCHEGDWADKLFESQRMTSDILKQRTGHYNGATLEE